MSRAARAWTGGLVTGLLGLVGVGLLVGAAVVVLASGGAGGFGGSDGGGDVHTAQTFGTVLDVDSDSSWDGSGVDVQFMFDGETQVGFIALDPGAPHPNRGDEVQIAYDPHDPDDVVLAEDVASGPPVVDAAGGHPLPLALSGLGVLLAAGVGLVLTIVWVRRAPRPAPLASWGWQQPPYGGPYAGQHVGPYAGPHVGAHAPQPAPNASQPAPSPAPPASYPPPYPQPQHQPQHQQSPEQAEPGGDPWSRPR